MESSYGHGTLVPTGRQAPSMNVRYQISQQLVEMKNETGSYLRPKAVVHSIAPESGQLIAFGDFDLFVGDQVVRLKHVDNDPEWLVLSSNAAAVCV